MLDISKKYILSDEIVIRGIGNKFWALNIKNGKQFRLNSTSYLIMNAFRDDTSLNTVVNMLVKEYNVERTRVINDCNVIIPFAIEKQLLKEVKP